MDGKLLIGWSEKDITPLKPCALAGQFYDRITEKVHDPITATVLALETTDKKGNTIEQAVMISCDLLMIEKHLQDGIRAVIAERIQDFDPQKLFLFATHTHTAPFTSVNELSKFGGKLLEYNVEQEEIITPSEYSSYVIEKVSDAVVEAWVNRRPGSIGTELGFAVVGFNRMVMYEDGTSRMYGSTDLQNFVTFAGPSDPGAELLFTWDDEGNLTGIAINIACPSQVVENMCYVSSDFWGEVRKVIRSRYSKDVYILAMTGAAGDQSPRDLTRVGLTNAVMRSEAGLEIIANRITDMVDKAILQARSRTMQSMEFKHLVEEIDLPIRKVTSIEFENARIEYERIIGNNSHYTNGRKVLENPDGDILFTLTILDGIINRYKKQQENPFYKAEIHVIRLGDVVFTTNPFELFVDYGLQMKARSKARQTFIIELACDCGLYLPTARAVAGGGYSTQVSNGFVGPDGGRLLTDHTVKLINSLMGQ